MNSRPAFITATIRSKKTIVDLVERVAENVFIPFTVGGGISTAHEIDILLRAGADEAVGEDVSADELAARMLALVRRARSERDRSPLTGLPGAARRRMSCGVRRVAFAAPPRPSNFPIQSATASFSGALTPCERPRAITSP